MKKTCMLIMILFCITSCAVNPVTQKKEIMLFSDQAEIEMGKSGHDAVLIQFGVYDNPDLQSYVDKVGQGVAKVSHRNSIPHHFMVVDSTHLNAFALPGGYIYITRGLMAYLNNEAQFAGVMGHEAGHVAARHGVKKYQKAMGAQLILMGVAVATESKGLVLGTDLILSAILQGYSRHDEDQADQLGTMYMYNAGYDPVEITEFFKVLEKMEKRTPNLIELLFSSHPPTSHRIEKTKVQTQELNKGTGIDLIVDHNRYISQLDGLVFGPGEREGVIEGRFYRNRYFQYQVQMPREWAIKRGETAGSVVAQDPAQRYLSQVIAIELEADRTPRQLAAMVERDSGLQALGTDLVTIDGSDAYLVDYKAQSQGGEWLGIRIAYVTRRSVGFIIATIARLQEFMRMQRTFNTVIFSFRSLSSREAATIPVHRLKVYLVKKGDTFLSISEKYYGKATYADDIKRFNGMEDLKDPPVGQMIKIKPLLPEIHG